jgi:wyosine [tRNA(Phe)-imidazoG37] synthetase (radical SAM superfamily)
MTTPNNSAYKTIFGPVSSRRFGVSLGIDLSPSHKQCNFDCLYCELAPAATMSKQENVISVETIMIELQHALQEHQNIDVITFTANGEPTMYPHLDDLLERVNAIKKSTQTLILTNSATLTDDKVFNTLLKFDQVKLSLDAVSKEVFDKIDRPYHDINIEHLVNRVITFSQAYKEQESTQLFMEVLFVHTLNDTPEEIKRLNDTLLHIKAKRVDIGTIDRPPAYPVMGISYQELHHISQQFDSSLPIHIASRQHAELNHSAYSSEEILNTLDKRPLTTDDVKLLFDEESQKRLKVLLQNNIVSYSKLSGVSFLVPTNNINRKKIKSV